MDHQYVEIIQSLEACSRIQIIPSQTHMTWPSEERILMKGRVSLIRRYFITNFNQHMYSSNPVCSIIDFNRSGLILPDSRTFSRTFPSLAVQSSHCMKNQITNFSQGFKRGLLQLLLHDYLHELIFCSFYKIQTRLLIENNSNLIE